MPFYVIKGTFHVKGYSPDGDSIRFKANNAANWLKLGCPPVKLNAKEHGQLRFEGIDTLETHYEGFHQPLPFAEAALQFLLNALAIDDVQWNLSTTNPLVVRAN